MYIYLFIPIPFCLRCFTVIDIYQDWAGPTVVLEDVFVKLKRTLSHTEYLTFYSANCENNDVLKLYRGYCEPLLLFFGVFITKIYDRRNKQRGESVRVMF